MNPVEQHELLSEITIALVGEVPAGWQRIVVDYSIEDGRVRVGSGVRMRDGSHVHVPVPRTLAPRFRLLREGDTWHRLSLVIDPPNTYHVRYFRDGG
ncbi:hypothetical protein [Actinophytocola sp. KF-1]